MAARSASSSPHVNTGDEAAATVAGCRYPPLGHRDVTYLIGAARADAKRLREGTARGT